MIAMASPKLAEYRGVLLEHLPHLRSLSTEELDMHIRWHISLGCFSSVRHNGKIIAVGLYRRVRSVDEAEKDRWAHRRDGKVVWIDQLAAPGCVLGHMLWHFLSREALEEPFTHFAGHQPRVIEDVVAIVRIHGLFYRTGFDAGEAAPR